MQAPVVYLIDYILYSLVQLTNIHDQIYFQGQGLI